jgi:hypothetical protein
MTAIAGHVMLHHKVYQNKLIQIQPRQKIGAFLCSKIIKASFKKANAKATT